MTHDDTINLLPSYPWINNPHNKKKSRCTKSRWLYFTPGVTLTIPTPWKAAKLECKEARFIVQGSRKGHPFLPGHHLQSEVLQSPEYQKDSLVFWLPQEPFAPQARDNSARDLWKLQSPKSTWLRGAGGSIYDIRYINSKEQSDPHIRVMSSRLGLGDWDKEICFSYFLPKVHQSNHQMLPCAHC